MGYIPYETGSWTPTLEFGGGSTGITYSTQIGSYTLIGRVVHFVFTIVLTSKGTDTGGAAIEGLPYTKGGANPTFAIGLYANLTYRSGYDHVVGAVNGTEIGISMCGDNAGNLGLDNTHFANDSRIASYGSYFMA
jgi:hypothetical protein